MIYQHAFMLTQYYKEIKNHSEQVSNINIFIDLYNQDGMKYPNVINSNNYVLFERKNLNIALAVLYVSVDIKPFIEKGEVNVCGHK